MNIPDIQYESKWYDSTIYTLIIPKDSNIFTLSNRIYESGLVEYAQPSFSRYTKLDGYETNSYFNEQWNLRDTNFNEQWNLRDTTITYDTWDNTPIYYNGINALRAWKFTTGSPDIKVAILDNGVEGTHEDLFNNFLMEWNYTGYSISSMENPKEHGTCCAGIISAANNNVGVVGIAHGCKIASFITHCKIRTNSNNRSDVNPPDNPIYYNDEMVADAIYYACDSIRIHVFSCSWSRKYYVEEILKSAINHATRYGRNGKGCIFVFSSGNKNNEWETDIIRPTAVLPNVLSVGGTTQTGYRVSQNLPDGEGVPEWESCFGDSLDLMAPGEVVWTTCNVSDSCYYEDFDGTSAAAPHVAGVAALILSMDTNLTYRQVFEILCSSATKVRSDYYFYSDNPSYPYGTWNNEMGYGLVNAHHAILKTLYRDYYMTGTSEIGLCETGSYHVHGTTPFNDSITCGWSSSSNIEILSTTDSLVARGTRPGPGWVAFNIIHDNDSPPQVFPVNVTNGGITILSNHEFTGNITLSSPHFTDADLIIDSLSTLTITDTLYIAGGSRLIIRPGGKLIVNGGTLTSSLSIPSGTLRYYHSAGSGHAPIGATSNVTVLNATANACGSTLCGVQGGGGGGSGLGPKGAPALAQYREMAEEYAAIVETCHGASPQTDAPDPQYETDNAALTVRLSDLSSQMGDLARTEIRNILCDSVPDMELLKQWYATIVETCHGASLQDSTIPVSAYQLAEVYSQEGGLSTAAALLAALPQQFIPDEAACSEYSNYMALQQLRETVAGNWYLMTDTDIEAMQRVAENGGRAARMAKEILCFFHHICYEDDMALNLGDIGERNLSGGRTDDGRTRCVPTDNGLVIYPNPTGGTLTVESASPIREITVYDLSGRVMMTANGGIVETCHGASLQMDVSSLQGGIYLLRVVTEKGVETGRFVKN